MCVELDETLNHKLGSNAVYEHLPNEREVLDGAVNSKRSHLNTLREVRSTATQGHRLVFPQWLAAIFYDDAAQRLCPF